MCVGGGGGGTPSDPPYKTASYGFSPPPPPPPTIIFIIKIFPLPLPNIVFKIKISPPPPTKPKDSWEQLYLHYQNSASSSSSHVPDECEVSLLEMFCIALWVWVCVRLYIMKYVMLASFSGLHISFVACIIRRREPGNKASIMRSSIRIAYVHNMESSSTCTMCPVALQGGHGCRGL